MDVLNTANIADVLRILRTRLLPVENAQWLLDSVEGPQPDARQAAVLVPVFELQGETYLAFIRRASTLRFHSGQIAFPGGKVEYGEAFPVMTALREAQEEIGLDLTDVEVLGLLPPVFTVVSNYMITPVVAYLPSGLGTLTLQSSEVAEVIQAPLRQLSDPAIAHTEEWLRSGRVRTIYFYMYHTHQIWGATGRMLATFLELFHSGKSLE
jgi:8-oxo-dGTP pyrophosphatase MutT (NUDIX family)